jgi:redox-sensing transcriptional repressor
MSGKPDRKIPELAVPRLSRYYRALIDSGDKEIISSEEMSFLTGYSAAQIRKDLTYFGQFGTPGLGYPVPELRKALLRILGIDREWNVALVGVGHLGAALLGYKGFRRQGFRLVAAFDTDPSKVGRTVEGIPILASDRLKEVARQSDIQMGIITVPLAAAQAAADVLVGAGIRAIMNFAPVRLTVPARVTVHNVDMAIELERLSFLSTRNDKGKG